jgi:uncharacterized protein involved in response to NO
MIESEKSFVAAEGPTWRVEPFRLFFPLGVVLAGIGVSHWVLYGTGITSTYSCAVHGAVQMQAFMMAFAFGFLFTALPRRTRSAPPSSLEMIVLASALIVTTAGALSERWLIAEAGYALQFLVLLQFAVRRFLGRGANRRPPAAFVLIPIGIVQGLVGAFLIAAADVSPGNAEATGLGLLLVEQGVFLCFVAGVGSLILPLMAGAPPPLDLDAGPRERLKAAGFATIGLVIFASFLLEHAGGTQAAPLLRAVAMAIVLVLGGTALRPPGKPGIHRWLVWIAVWLIPIGLFVSALLPDYRVPALHIVFIGGFSLMGFAVATHVALNHLGMEAMALRNPPAIIALGAFLLLAMITRLVADMSDAYFLHLTWAALFWLSGAAIWLGFLGPHLLRRKRRQT